MAKIIAFSNQKGGVGKTTICVNLAAYCAQSKKRVLIVDLDAQANATSCFGIFDKKAQNSSYDMLFGGKSAAACIRDTEIDGLQLLPASNDLSAAEIELSRVEQGRERMLKANLAALEDDFDYIFIDCAPSLGLLAVNALTAANGVIVPIVCEYFALEGLSQTINTVRLVRKFFNPHAGISGVVLNMYDKRSRLTKDVQKEVERLFGNKVFDAVIPKNVRLAESPSFGKPISLYDKNCAGAVALGNLAQEFIQKI